MATKTKPTARKAAIKPTKAQKAAVVELAQARKDRAAAAAQAGKTPAPNAIKPSKAAALVEKLLNKPFTDARNATPAPSLKAVAKATTKVLDKPAKAPKAAKPLGQRAQVRADAEAGKLPTPPDWTKRTHYRAAYEALVAAAKAGDLKALLKVELNPGVSQLCRFRDLAEIALRARTQKASAAAIRRPAVKRAS